MSNNRELEPYRSWLIGISAIVHLLVSDSVNAGLNKDVLSDIKVPAIYESVMGAYHSFKEVEVGSWLELNEMVQPEKNAEEGAHGTVGLPKWRVEPVGERLNNSPQH